MNNLTEDFIAIDTNVFEHILNPEKNTDSHITDPHISELLETLHSDEILLLVDTAGKMEGEYNNRIKPKFKKSWDIGNNLNILKLWFVAGIEMRKKVDVDMDDNLMVSIKRILPPGRRNNNDRIFVYVAFKECRVLVTNDEHDIVSRRTSLKRKTRQHRHPCPGEDDKSDILTSIEAYDNL